ncbi:MAG: hypothetical protein LBO69_01040 [Ignavibacteria bacterium]|jgi:hypothetical protein|nr:hypothetical protein [Ignavibacteria bacterium]
MKKCLIIFIATIILIATGCRTVEDCTENKILGNMGSIVNSNDDEYSPTAYVLPYNVKMNNPDADTNDYLYFTATRYDSGRAEKIYNVMLNDILQGAELIDAENHPEFPMNNDTLFRNAGVPVFRYNPITDKIDLFFAAHPKIISKWKFSKDIWHSALDMQTDEWSTPEQISINSDKWDSHPTISPDGRILLFASDREGGVGDIDIWGSFWDDDIDDWGEPFNLGPGINTSERDYFPMFTYDNDIIFSSEGRGKIRKDFDIYYAQYDSMEKKWVNPRMYGFPINTEFNETGACIWNNKIFLSSDRRGGCGGMDIYSFQICGPVFIAGNIKCNNPNEILEGTIILLNETADTLETVDVGVDGAFSISNIEANKNYNIHYVNKCYPNKKNEYNFKPPCSDSSVMKVVLNMIMPEKHTEIELTEVEIPYFVTGYYKPNTEKNLNSLRLGFSYNIYGNNPKSKYIENPADKYNKYVPQVESKLNEVVEYIANILSVIDNRCDTKKQQGILTISIQGYADPRNISAGSEYLDDDIYDDHIGMYVKKNAKMNNELLSKLRAYYTAKYFQAQIAKDPNIAPLLSRIKWNINGKGVDSAENVEDGLKRKVKIKLDYKE